jgi:hypothetical protein
MSFGNEKTETTSRCGTTEAKEGMAKSNVYWDKFWPALAILARELGHHQPSQL